MPDTVIVEHSLSYNAELDTAADYQSKSNAACRILGIGTAAPAIGYNQTEVLDFFSVTSPRIRSVFLNGGIERRRLSLPEAVRERGEVEQQAALLRKHLAVGLEIGGSAIARCLERAGAEGADIGYLCCVTSTGFLVPGLSALLIRELGLRTDCARLDIVGMGCNAGLNALCAATSWAKAHPSQLAVMVCIEVCSAMYVFDHTMRSAVVNSLFGDGAAAIALTADHDVSHGAPRIVRFASLLIPDAMSAMEITWDDTSGKFSFGLEADVPYVVGANVERAVDQLLRQSNLSRRDIAHWVVHSGGRKVIDALRVNLGLSRHDLRHTLSVLSEYGNVSSGSFLFSFQRLLEEGVAAKGDLGVCITMGPGSTIETALLEW